MYDQTLQVFKKLCIMQQQMQMQCLLLQQGRHTNTLNCDVFSNLFSLMYCTYTYVNHLLSFNWLLAKTLYVLMYLKVVFSEN